VLREWWVSTNRATFWVETTGDFVSDAAPISKKFVGQPFSNLLNWFDYRFGGLKYQELRYRRSGGAMPRGFRLVSRGEGDLKTRYRPQTMQEAVPTFPVRRVKNIIEDPNAAQVYLFEGITGTGKTTCARIIARAAICECEGDKPCLECSACRAMENSRDYTEINVANFRKIDDIRAIIDGMRYLPSELKVRVLIFDEVHQLTPDSQQLLLKVLEEPPRETLIFLCTTEKTGLKRTLISRALEINFKRVTRAHATKIVEQIFEDHDKGQPSDELLNDMFSRADGSIRDLLNLLQAYLDDDYEIGMSEQELEVSPDVKELARALMRKDWQTASGVLQAQKVKKAPESFRIGVSNYLRAIALNKSSVRMDVASALGQIAGTLYGEPPIEQYNLLVLRCLRACYKK
jgi:DNA polymerase III subunit gamma/tau